LRRLVLAACVAGALPAITPPCLASTEEAKSYVLDAQKLLDKGDFAGAEIQLRNATRANPDDPTIHVLLAGVYLKVGNLPAAEAEARLARQTHGSPDAVDPLLADVLLRAFPARSAREQNREARIGGSPHLGPRASATPGA
jgi:predicted Zn-dependent protease